MNSEEKGPRDRAADDGSSARAARIPGDRSAPGAARRAIRSWLDGHARTDDAALAVSEVVTNVVRHGLGDAPLTVRLVANGEGIRIEVDQPTVQTVEAPSGFPGPDRAGGRGLAVVEALAERWGVTYGTSIAPHTTVWFEM